jgi:hypothetical protein
VGESRRRNARDAPAVSSPDLARPAAIRRLASILVLVVAGLAVAGTSASPTPPPTIQSEATGALELGPDRQMASVEVTVTANAALLADATNRTSVTVSRVNAPGENLATGPISVMAIELVGAGVPAVTGTAASLADNVTSGCPLTGDCTRTYRISAALTGPADGPVAVGWRVVAESRLGVSSSPVSAPPGARLTITSGDPVAVTDHSAAGAIPAATVRLDPNQPRFVQTVTVVQPRSSTEAIVALRSAVQRDHAERYLEQAAVGFESVDGTLRSSYGFGSSQEIRLPACAEAKGCRTDLRIFGDWRGGPLDEGATVDLALGASLMSLAADEPVTGTLAIEAGELTALKAEPAGRTTGTIATGGKVIQRRQIEVAFDRSALDGVIPGDARQVRSGVALLATMTAATRSATGNTRDVLIHASAGFASGPTGARLELSSEAIPVSCVGSTCSATIDLEAWNYDAPAGDVTVDWTLDVGLVLDPSVTISSDDLKVRFTTSDTSGP